MYIEREKAKQMTDTQMYYYMCGRRESRDEREKEEQEEE